MYDVYPDDRFKSLSAYHSCVGARVFFFVTFMLVFSVTLSLLALYLPQCISQRRLKKATRGARRGNDRDLGGRSGGHVSEADLEGARGIELSDWTTYDDRITAPPPARSTRPRPVHSRITLSSPTVSARYQRSTAQPASNRARTIEPSERATIRAPPPAYSTRARAELPRTTPTRVTTSIRYSAPPPAYKSTETLPHYTAVAGSTERSWTTRPRNTASGISPPGGELSAVVPYAQWAWRGITDVVGVNSQRTG
ncbi:MAG: hypothetical protein LQ337_005037 [Flavoplaca oasis]|nr:MAG: hypothetical protein LQ337_005037 [Flavoplaca oasis]